MTLPYNRALLPSELRLPELEPYVNDLNAFQQLLDTLKVPYRKDHEYRTWEWANVRRQLDELKCGPRILDTGFGYSMLTPYLAAYGYDVTAEDSMGYGDCVPKLVEQCLALNLRIPVCRDPLEDMHTVPSSSFDVAICVSTIEHVSADRYADALKELARVTRIGGHVFVTSDYFRSDSQADQSPYRNIQHTAFTAERVLQIPDLCPALRFAGSVDLTYHGDFVNNYSFINLAFEVVK